MGQGNGKEFRGQLDSLSTDELERLLIAVSSGDGLASQGNVATEDSVSNDKPKEQVFPATQAQVLFWRIYAADPRGYDNHQSISFRISGPLDVEAMKQAFDSLSLSQPSLRTLIYEDEEDVWQRILPSAPIPFEFIEKAGVPKTDEYIHKPFDLENEPPIRVRVIMEGDGDHLLQIVMHHIATDGRSKVVLLEQLSGYYNAIVAGRKPEVASLPANLGDWALEERSWLSGSEAKAAEDHWKVQPYREGLGHPWPIEREWAASNEQDLSVDGRTDFVIDGELSERLRASAAERGMTVFQLLAGTYFLTLQRLMPGIPVTVGMPVDMRRSVEEAGLVGCLMNVVPVTMDTEMPETVDEYLRLAGQRIREAIEHSRLPLLKIHEASLSSEVAVRSTAWKTVFNFKEDHTGALSLEGCAIRELPFVETGNGADLLITFPASKQRDRGGPILLTVDNPGGAPPANVVKSLFQTWRSVIEQCVSGKVSAVSDIDILLPGERERIRELSGIDHMVEYPDKTLHAIFRETAGRYPDRPAVIEADGRETSYQELRSEVDRIAGFLRSKGVGRDVVVAVHMQRSSGLVAALFGILEAGGAFLLMEPRLPTDRLRTMAEESRVFLVITEEGMPPLPGYEGVYHRMRDILTAVPIAPEDPTSICDPSSLAYVMFTSGSTGVPKGGMVEHQNIVNRLSYSRDALGFGTDDRALQKSPLSFDVCLTELLLPMLTGGAIVLADAVAEVDMQRIAELVYRHRVSYLHFTPTALKAFLEVPDVGKVNGILRMIRCGGESLSDAVMRDYLSTLDAVLFQSYGPAETAVAVTLWRCRQEHGYPKPPIGRPNANVDILIMDGQGRPVPPGLPGELWIGGAQTGRGYINNAEDTRKRFVDDPIEPGSGRRYYRTGDLARFLPDGNLLFLGRMDDQLKVRGVRIELGDVTAALLRCEGVKEAVVLAEPDGEGSNRLRAWVTLKKGFEGKESAIRSSLMELLPGYMIPFRIHVIDCVPLTAHGKTDHRALRVIADEAGVDSEGLPLETPTENRLAEIWSKLLGVEVTSRDADFFGLGGHSLVAMRLSPLIRKEYNVTVSLADFYADGRLGSLAARIDRERGEGKTGLSLSGMPALQPGERVPMSWAQRRMWILQHMLTKPSSYHIARLFDLPSKVSPPELKGMLQAMAERHGILRTRLWQDEEGFWQEEIPSDEWRMDWYELEAASREELTAFMQEEKDRTFDLSHGTTWRARWVRERGMAPHLLLVFHHAITDEWSMHMMGSELVMLLTGKSLPLKAHRKDYGYIDFSRWQHWTFASGLRERLESYWRERLGDLGEQIQFTPDFKTSEAKPGRSERVSLDLDSGIHALMDGYCRKGGLSRFSVWMSVWQVLQARMGRGEEVLLATPVSERDRPEWQEVWGMFLNTLLIRTRVDGKLSFRSFSEAGHRSLARDLTHGQLAYEDIVRVADLDFGAESQGLPQVMFVLHGEHEWIEEEAAASDDFPWPTYAKNDLSVHLSECGGGVKALLIFDADRFSESTAQSILKRFESVARQVLAEPDMRISDIDMLLPGERERIMDLSGRHNIVPYPDTTLHAIFRETADRYPDRPAVIEADGRKTSYADLQREAMQVAAYLSELGLEREAVVAIHMQRSPALLATMLGVMEYGCAFLLLEPSLPMDRLRTVSEQARVQVVITEAGMAVIDGYSDRTHLFSQIQVQDSTGWMIPHPNMDSHSLACVIFTSGSTGVPKGAMLEHRNLVNYLFFLHQAYSLGSDLRTLQKTAFSFDLSLYELLLPMTTGGVVVLAETGMETDMSCLLDIVFINRVTCLFFTPAHLNLFIREPDLEKVNGILKVILSAGEALDESLMQQCLDSIDVMLYNGYGPAETAVTVTLWRCDAAHVYPKPPIGCPNPNVDVLIMDAMGRPVPPGMAGELWIGGVQTGRGYINNGEETSRRFVVDPIEPGSGRRYYRTGDLARFLPDGNLLFLGRMDDQLKVRGVRIELGDVTAALLRCDGVKEAVVLAEPDGEGSNRLRAWVTLKHGFKGGESTIRSSLMDLLPGYMVPFRIHVIDSIPLTTNGKTDHRALLELTQEADDDMGGIPLSTPTERKLAELWSKLLGVDVKRRDADFFRLGGHSLIAMRLSAFIRKEYDVPISLADFYADGRLDTLAERIDRGRGHDVLGLSLSDLPALLPSEKVPMSSSQRRMWMLQHLLDKPSTYHISILLKVPDGCHAEEVKYKLQMIADRHGILRTRLYQDEDGCWQEELPMEQWQLDWGDVEVSSHDALNTLLDQERHRVFQFEKGSPWRARLISQKDKGSLLFLVFHHAVTDEWSMWLLRRELESVFSGSENAGRLPVPAHNYSDFARWQHWAFSGGARERHERYWRDRLRDMGEIVRIEPDRLLPAQTPGRQGRVAREIDDAVVERMEAYCRQEALGLFSFWMSVWQLLLFRLGRGQEVLLATPVSERNRPEWHDVWGMFLNTLPIRVKVEEDRSFRSFSAANHRMLGQDLAHAQLPYEDIVRLADVDLGADGNGLTQVMFVMHGEHEWSEEDEEWRRDYSQNGYVDNPLTLHIMDRRGVFNSVLVFDKDRFDPRTAEGMLDRLVLVARQLLADPDMRIADIDVLLPGERERLHQLSGVDNVTDYPDKTLHAIFSETAERYPNRPAVIEADGRETSYADMKVQVLCIASFLLSKGIRNESVVAVHMSRSPALLAAILGVLEAGGAFLLLEPSLPKDRLRTMAEQSGVELVLTDEGLERLRGFEEATFVFTGMQFSDTTQTPAHCDSSGSHSLAYVMFTSGSTGMPKGAMLDHGNIVAYVRSCCDVFGFGPDDRTLLKSTLSFDLCFFELFIPLFTGGALIMSGSDSDNDFQHLVDLVVKHRVTHLAFTPPMVDFFLKSDNVSAVAGILKVVVCGGEAFGDSLMVKCRALLGSRVYQDYGPVETTVAVTSWEHQPDHGYPKPPIGRPNPNVDIRIMDAMGRPVPSGLPGELWIGGAQTGRGYINNAEETRKRFVDDPLEPGSGRRYYRTGDLARFLPDGNLLFLGRMDDQLKVRGVRIELGDVTAALLRCDGVNEAVVLAEPDGEGSNRLRAWVTLRKDIEVNESAIRASLMDLLPGYMVPFRIHVIDSMPLTAHGKTDHRALRAIADGDGYNSEGLPLETPTEKKLAEIWSRLLGVEVKSRDADFFRLGGHSLTAMRLAGMVNKEFKVILPLPELYADGRLERQASGVDVRLAERTGADQTGDELYRIYPVWKGESPKKVYSFFMDYRIIEKIAMLGGWDWSVINLIDPQVQRGQTPDMPVEALAPVYAEAILAEHKEGPIVMMGNCINGIDAYATACHLQERTNMPIHVLLFDTRCPTVADQLQSSPSNMLESLFPDAIRRLAEKGLRGSRMAKFALNSLAGEALAHRLFDPEWYLKRYPDVAKAGMDPLSHYFAMGWKENRVPSLVFKTSLYRYICPEFSPGRQNPVLHYLIVGRLKAPVRKAVRGIHTSVKDCERILASGWFDADWYTREYEDVACHGRSPLGHYMAIGWRFGRSPFPGYDPEEFGRRFHGFNPRTENPLRHLLSMREIPQRPAEAESRTAGVEEFEKSEIPVRLSAIEEGKRVKPFVGAPKKRHNGDDDIVGLRGKIRSLYVPGNFRGEVYVFSNQFSFETDPVMGWQEGIHGNLHSIRMNGDHDSYLIDDLKGNALRVDKVVRDILYPRRPEG